MLAAPASALALDVQVSPSPTQQPRVTADPTNPQRFVARYQKSAADGSIDSCYVATSTNAGQTWSEQKLVGPGGTFALPSALVPGGVVECLDSQVSVGPNGTIYYLYESRQLSGLGERRVYLTTSSNSGASWTTPHEIHSTNGLAHTDLWSSMAVDPQTGRLYVAWLRYCEPPVPANAPGGRDGLCSERAQSARRLLRRCWPDLLGPRLCRPGLAQSSAHLDHGRPGQWKGRRGLVRWRGLEHSSRAAQLKPADSLVDEPGSEFRRGDVRRRRGRELDRVREAALDTAQLLSRLLHVLAGKSANQLFLARWDIDPMAPGQRCRVFFQRSTDGGASWSPAQVVGNAGLPANDQQHRPRLALSPDGNKLYMLYYDIDTATHRQDVYRVTSTDGGVTWSSPERVSDVSSDSAIGPVDRDSATHERSFGEWLGVDASTAGVVGAWTDSRLNTQNVFSDTLGP